MDQLYDEDLSSNKYFEKLRNEHKILLETAAMEKWMICIPRSETIQLDEQSKPEFVLSHILIPNDEIPGYNFTNLMGDTYERCDKILFGKNKERRQILFEEIFYTKEFFKLKLWCISFPLTKQDLTINDLESIDTTEEASHFLVRETGSPAILKILTNICSTFRQETRSSAIELSSVDALKSVFKKLQEKCLKIIFARKSLRTKFNADSYLSINLKVSIALWTSLQLYDHIFEYIQNMDAEKSESFNKSMQNMSKLKVCELNIPSKYLQNLGAVKQQFLKIGAYKTPIGKLQCLKKGISKISEYGEVLVDDLIPIIVFAIVKSGYAFWIPTIDYIRKFIDIFETFGKGYENFLLTTFDAAIYFIMSGINQSLTTPLPTIQSPAGIVKPSMYSSKDEFLKYLFETIESNDELGTLEILNLNSSTETGIFQQNTFANEKSIFSDTRIESSLMLCHPLCACKPCQEKISQHTLNVNSCDTHGRTALHLAAGKGFSKMVNILITLGASVKCRDDEDSTPLHYACRNGHQNVLLLLLHSNADIINTQTKSGVSTLYLASLYGHAGCVKAMLFFADHMRIEYDINIQDSNGNTALHMSSKYGFIEITECLLEYGADPLLNNKLGASPFTYANNKRVKELLKKCISEIENDCITDKFRSDFEQIRNVRSEKIFTSIKNHDVKLLEFYLDGSEKYLLRSSPKLGKYSVDKQKYMDFLNCLENEEGLNPLQYAASLNFNDIIGILIETGARVNYQNKNGETALHVACKQKNLHAVSTLLQLSDVNFVDLQDKFGNTALHYAVKTASFEISQIILQHFPDLDIKNKDNMQPLDIARKRMLLNIVILLEKSL